MTEMTLVERVKSLEQQMKVADPAKYSVQSRAEASTFAPSSDVNGGGGLFWITMGTALDEEPKWNALYPNYRDRYLLNFSRTEGMIASAIYSMKTRIGTLDRQLNGPPRAKRFAQELLENPGLGDSTREVIQKVSGDLDTSDNGAFIELWRAGNPLKEATGPVLGFAHLDSRQCWRSYDPEFPVWYTHPVSGIIRKIHRSRITFSADNPQSVELARGIGFCATSRALRMARTFRSMQIFLDEKVSGRFTRAIGAVSGINANQLRNALASNAAEADAKGFVIYQDIPFLINPSTEPGNDVKIMLQDLASIPDGFSFRDDADLYAYILAFAFGVDAREFWPATQSGATKADASVQNMKAQGRGIGNRIQTVTGMIRDCLPETVEFEFDYTDDAQDLLAAQINQTRVQTFDMMIKNGTIDARQSYALSIAAGILDETVLSTMEAPVTSDSNPDTPQEALTNPDGSTTPNQTTPQTAPNGAQKPVVEGKAMKSFDDYRRSLRALTRGYWAGDIGAFDFLDGMTSAVTRHFEQAWEEVEKQYGITVDERTTDSQSRLDLAINTEVSYISGFMQAIAENNKTSGGALQPLLDRAELWAYGWDRTIQLAQIVVAPDIKMRWDYGDTVEHCDDCSQYEGKIFFKSQWEAAGAIPQSNNLACSGIQCDCRLTPTTERKTRGNVPMLVGHKLYEPHIHANGAHETELAVA